MKKQTETPDSVALVHLIKHTIRVQGIIFCNVDAANTIILADMGMTAGTQRQIIDYLDISDYVTADFPAPYPYRHSADFFRKFNGISLAIKIAVGMECTPAVCLKFVPQQLLI